MLTRRRFLHGLAGIGAVPLFLRSMAAEAASAGNTILVTILLEGGNDGLNTVVPLKQYGAYTALRGQNGATGSYALNLPLAGLAATAFDHNWVTPAGSASEFAFHPSMTALRNLYGTGKLAVLAGIGLPAQETAALNHEAAILDWQVGQVNCVGKGDAGWIGQVLDNASGGALPAMVSLSGNAPNLMQGLTAQALVLPTPIDNFQVSTGGGLNFSNLSAGFAKILAASSTNQTRLYGDGVMNGAVGLSASVQSIAQAVPAYDYPVATGLDQQLREIARLIIGKAGARGYYAVQSGYDTHVNQGPIQADLLTGLSNGLANFYNYLKKNAASQNVVIMTISDFGRRPAPDSTNGTDHGGASVGLVLGDPVTGGVYGNYPSLTALDANANLAMQVDFRNVIADVVTSMGGNAATILGQSYPRLGFI